MQQPLFKYKTYVQDKDGNDIEDSWGLVSVERSMILEGYYDMHDKTLVLLMDSAKDYKSVVPVMTNRGLYKKDTKGEVVTQVEKVSQYHQVKISNQEDIDNFLAKFCINP